MSQIKQKIIAFTVASTVLPAVVYAADEDKLSSQRKLFVTIEKQLQKKKNRLFTDSLTQLKDYPLLPYLHSLDLINRLNQLDQKDIDSFAMSWPSAPSGQRLQQQWLSSLATKKRWADYLIAYERSDVYHVKYQCLNGVANYKEGNYQAAWSAAVRLWLVGKSQNKACDPLFVAWKKNGGLTQSLAFDRFWLAAENGSIQLAKYIDNFITDKSLKKQTSLFLKVHHTPSQLYKKTLLDKNKQRHRFIYLNGLARLTHQKEEQAITLWLKDRDRYPFTMNEIAMVDRKLALRLAKRLDAKNAAIIAKLDPLFSYPKVTEWRIRLALIEQDWASVLALISELPEEYIEKNRWKYWQAVATIARQSEQGILEDDATILKRNVFTDISKERDFYGFLVADISDSPFQLNQSKGIISVLPLKELIADFKGIQRMREWVYHERYYKAQSELNRIKPSLSSNQKKMVAYLAKDWDWHHQAIMTAAKEALWDDLELRFPSHMSDVFKQFSKEQAIDHSWAMAIARQESAFNPQAYSHAGARGLMQLMPATARETANKNNIRYGRTSELYHPNINIALGTAHLSELIKRYKNNKVFATAAYNAGARRVNSWIAKRGHLPLDIWIETIPFDETRQYVKNVLSFRVIYNHMNKQSTRMLTAKEASQISISALSPRSLPLSEFLLTKREP
ncbi:MAG: transglycosylase SLT domain-containing protein [Endozoicomonas sp. (ex Botrylloides leachii)]|nr:transglycosylase SLT domain-containing protein [Endozoicomonas sp. (ex Botrylloides leachii)]